MDQRIPVLIASPDVSLPADAAVLADSHQPWPGAIAMVHVAPAAAGPPSCTCCAPRSQLARTLGRLFQARARGQVAFFTCVVAPPSLAADIRTALETDVLVQARYRAAGAGVPTPGC